MIIATENNEAQKILIKNFRVSVQSVAKQTEIIIAAENTEALNI